MCGWKTSAVACLKTSDGEGPPEGALQMGPYVRPQNPLESSMTRTGRVCLQFHVKGSPESSVLQLKVGWTYVQHGQNRDSMLGKIKEPEVVQILALLKQLSIPSSERQSAEKLKCLKIAEDALSLLQGRVPNEKNPTDQVHIIVKLHRVKTREEKKEGVARWKRERCRFFEGETVDQVLADFSTIPGFR